MKNLFEEINNILADWNPIGVPKEIALDEYRAYIPVIVRVLNKKGNLWITLENILNEIGLEYNSENPEHFKDLKEVCEKLIKIYGSKRYD